MEIVDVSTIKFIHGNIGNKNNKRFKGTEKDGERTCGNCCLSKPLNSYYKGRHPQCKECVSNSRKNYYAKKTGRTVEEVQANIVNRTVVIVDKKKKCGWCRQWKLISCFNNDKYTTCGLRAYCIDCGRSRSRAYSFKENKRIKFICMMGYGGRCVCCGISDISLLTIEHIRYKKFKLMYGDHTRTLMKKLIELNWPIGYEIRCYNCNCSSSYMPCIHSAEHKKYIDKYIVPYSSYGRQKELDELERKWNIMNEV